MDTLTGKIAFVTGGGNGIGMCLARRFAAEGTAVAVTDVDGSRAEQVAAEIRATGGKSLGLPLDVQDLDQWNAAASRVERELGPVSVLCANAGVASAQSILESTPIENISLGEWHWMLGINLTGQFYGLKTFLPKFKSRRNQSHILATASMAGIVPQFAEVPGAYTVSKYAVVGLYEQLLLELASFPQIGLTLLCPGVVRTSIQSHTLANAPYLDDQSRQKSSANSYAENGEMKFGMEPANVASAAVAAVKNKRLYAFTHPEYGSLTRAYHARIQSAFGDSAQPGYSDPLPG